MFYRIRALKTGECQVCDYITYGNTQSETTSTFFLYIWLIEGGENPIIVDTGPKDLECFNQGTAQYIPGGVLQRPEERTPVLLQRAGVGVAQVRYVLVTHLHADHYEYFDLFPNAKLVVNGRGFLEGLQSIKANVMQALAQRWPDSLRLVEEEEVLPGIRVFPLGCHSTCSQGIAVDTRAGVAVLCGDVVYTYRNIEEDIPIGWADSIACRAAMERIRREADIILPGHDPLVLERFPEGIG